MHKTSRNRPGPYCHTRHNAADQLRAQNKPESPVPFRHKRRNAAEQLHAQNKPESPDPFRHTRHNAAEQLHAQNKPELPRPLPPQTPERGGPTPCTKQAGIAPARSATNATTRRSNSMHKTSRNRPGPFRYTRRNAAEQLHAQNEPESPRPLPPQTPQRGGATPCTERADIARPVPPQTPERGGPTPCTKQADIAPASSATHAGTRRTNSMHKASRNRPVPFRHKRHNAADQLHAQNEPESPVPFRHTRRNAADQLHAQNKPESPRPLPPQTPERGNLTGWPT